MAREVVVPTLPHCDLCMAAEILATAAYDGKTTHGPWANMCRHCFEQFGIGLGTGKGQRLILRTEAAATPAPERVTLLAGGDSIYLYAPGDPDIDAMESVLDVAYPVSSVERRTISAEQWEAAAPKFKELGVEIIDVRLGRAE